MSSALTVTRNESVAVVAFGREPVNSMDLSFWRDLLSSLDELEKDPSIRGVIYVSTLRRPVFTAGNIYGRRETLNSPLGNDLKELYAPMTSQARHAEFWLTSNQFLARLLVSPLVTLAAVKGSCPAGGCALAMSCDLRVTTSDGRIGLNEVLIGLSVPEYFMRAMERLIGTRETERACLTGAQLSADDALRLGLVDAVVESERELMPRAGEFLKSWLKLPDAGRVATKKALRGQLASEWGNEARLRAEAKQIWALMSDPRTIDALKATMDRLSGNKRKSNKI